MEELDALLKERMQTVTINEKKLVEEDVPNAISNIDRICSQSISEIEIKSRQIVERVSSWVETATAEFLNETEAARAQIKALVEDRSDRRTVDLLTSMISETSYLSMNRISKCAEVSINKIRVETSKSVLELRTNAANAFKDFRALAANTTKKIREAVEKAGENFKASKQASEGAKSLEQVKKETSIAIAEAESASIELENAKARTIERINEAVHAASRRIELAHTDAAAEIKIAKDRAELKLKEIADDAVHRLAKP
jgi:hypothetical protein